MAEGPKFALYVRPVSGHLVPRYGTREYLGARVTKHGIEWDTDRIIPLTDEYERTYSKELSQDIDNGALKRASEEEYAKQREADASTPEQPNEGKSKGKK